MCGETASKVNWSEARILCSETSFSNHQGQKLVEEFRQQPYKMTYWRQAGLKYVSNIRNN